MHLHRIPSQTRPTATPAAPGQPTIALRTHASGRTDGYLSCTCGRANGGLSGSTGRSASECGRASRRVRARALESLLRRPLGASSKASARRAHASRPLPLPRRARSAHSGLSPAAGDQRPAQRRRRRRSKASGRPPPGGMRVGPGLLPAIRRWELRLAEDPPVCPAGDGVLCVRTVQSSCTPSTALVSALEAPSLARAPQASSPAPQEARNETPQRRPGTPAPPPAAAPAAGLRICSVR